MDIDRSLEEANFQKALEALKSPLGEIHPDVAVSMLPFQFKKFLIEKILEELPGLKRKDVMRKLRSEHHFFAHWVGHMIGPDDEQNPAFEFDRERYLVRALRDSVVADIDARLDASGDEPE